MATTTAKTTTKTTVTKADVQALMDKYGTTFLSPTDGTVTVPQSDTQNYATATALFDALTAQAKGKTTAGQDKLIGWFTAVVLAPNTGVSKAATSVGQTISTAAGVIQALTTADTWIRILEVVAGMYLLFLGIKTLTTGNATLITPDMPSIPEAKGQPTGPSQNQPIRLNRSSTPRRSRDPQRTMRLRKAATEAANS